MMNECQYNEVQTQEEVENEEIGKALLWRQMLLPMFQLFVVSSVWMVHFLTGLSVGATTVCVQQIRRDNTTNISDEELSWLSSVYSYSALPWVFILSSLAYYIGRKKTFIIVCLHSIIIYLTFYFGETVNHLLITFALSGIFHASNLTLSILIVTEYTSPKYRGLFLNIKSATIFWGIWIANAIGTFFDCKNIALVGLVCSFYTLSVFAWPESPFWLAKKSRHTDCKKSHTWIKGNGENSSKELEILLQNEKYDKKNNLFNKINLSAFIKTITSPGYYKPIGLTIIIMAQYSLSGKIVYSVYAIQMINRITESESAAYVGMLILDAVTVSSMYLGCAMSKFVKRRTLLFTSATIASSFLLILSFYLYLVRISVLEEDNIVSISLLSGFTFAMSCGPVIMSSCLFGDLIPIEYKSVSAIIIALSFNLMIGTVLKVSPLLFETFGCDGTFLFFGLGSFICTIFLYFNLPETKDKSLDEIRDIFVKNKSDCN